MQKSDAQTGSLDALVADLHRRLDRLEAMLAEVRSGPSADGLLTVAEKASQLGCSTDTVRTYARELGGIELPTSGSRRHWRFPADSTLAPRSHREAPHPNPSRPKRRATARRDLLPISRRLPLAKLDLREDKPQLGLGLDAVPPLLGQAEGDAPKIATAPEHDTDPTFHEFATDWLAARAPELRPATVEAYRNELTCHLLPFFHAHRLSQITVAEVDRYREHKLREAEKGSRDRGLAEEMRGAQARPGASSASAARRDGPVVHQRHDHPPRGDPRRGRRARTARP